MSSATVLKAVNAASVKDWRDRVEEVSMTGHSPRAGIVGVCFTSGPFYYAARDSRAKLGSACYGHSEVLVEDCESGGSVRLGCGVQGSGLSKSMYVSRAILKVASIGCALRGERS